MTAACPFLLPFLFPVMVVMVVVVVVVVVADIVDDDKDDALRLRELVVVAALWFSSVFFFF